jgi:hypothetical protein
MTAIKRERFPNRRLSETFDFECAGLRYTCTVGRFSGGTSQSCFYRTKRDDPPRAKPIAEWLGVSARKVFYWGETGRLPISRSATNGPAGRQASPVTPRSSKARRPPLHKRRGTSPVWEAPGLASPSFGGTMLEGKETSTCQII